MTVAALEWRAKDSCYRVMSTTILWISGHSGLLVVSVWAQHNSGVEESGAEGNNVFMADNVAGLEPSAFRLAMSRITRRKAQNCQ